MPRANKPGLPFSKQRRKILKLLGLGTAVSFAQSATGQIRIQKVAEIPKQITTVGPPAYISVKLLRPEDLLSLELRYYNFTRAGNALQKLGNPAYVVVIFQPQTISEQAWKEEGGGVLETPTVPGKILIGGDSRLVFEIPATVSSIQSTTEDLLD